MLDKWTEETLGRAKSREINLRAKDDILRTINRHVENFLFNISLTFVAAVAVCLFDVMITKWSPRLMIFLAILNLVLFVILRVALSVMDYTIHKWQEDISYLDKIDTLGCKLKKVSLELDRYKAKEQKEENI